MGKKLKRLFLSLIFILLSTWLSLNIMFHFFQSNFIYFPDNTVVTTPDYLSLDYEDLTLKTNDGIELNAWWIPNPNARATLLFFHGNAGNISHRLGSINIFHKLGLSVFIIDYRGYGKSTGKPTEKGTYIDAETAWNYLIKEKNVKPDNIIIFGRSLGGAIAAWLAEKHQATGLIIESSFTSIAEIGKHYYPYLPTSLLARIKYPSINRMQNIHSPVLVIHSATDEIVPYKFGQDLFNAANEPKTFLDIQGNHNDGYMFSGNTYINGLNHFISGIVQE
ncbi:MAG: alpha/beta hydrolase [Proteobacteria bacterium]|nr:alpha/beta hydrolase [Pseudomonadota bacterium]NOG59447.1 alpha/beta hydrolase [Pseudomonadota bacterium]